MSRFKTGGENGPTASPRDRYITVYGRKPVFEALQDPSLELAAVMIADNASGAIALAASVVAFELARRREANAGDERGHPGDARRVTADRLHRPTGGNRPAQSSTIDSQRR